MNRVFEEPGRIFEGVLVIEFCKIGKNVISSETRNLVNELIL